MFKYLLVQNGQEGGQIQPLVDVIGSLPGERNLRPPLRHLYALGGAGRVLF